MMIFVMKKIHHHTIYMYVHISQHFPFGFFNSFSLHPWHKLNCAFAQSREYSFQCVLYIKCIHKCVSSPFVHYGKHTHLCEDAGCNIKSVMQPIKYWQSVDQNVGSRNLYVNTTAVSSQLWKRNTARQLGVCVIFSRKRNDHTAYALFSVGLPVFALNSSTISRNLNEMQFDAH